MDYEIMSLYTISSEEYYGTEYHSEESDGEEEEF